MKKEVKRKKKLLLVNRVLIVMAVAAILGGLLMGDWRTVLRNAILL